MPVFKRKPSPDACVACEGKGKSSRGTVCYPCHGTGKKRHESKEAKPQEAKPEVKAATKKRIFKFKKK